MLHLHDIKYARHRSRRRAAGHGTDDFVAGQNVEPFEPYVARQTASAYNYVGNDYSRYADGDGTTELSQPGNRFAHADAIVWKAVCSSLDELRQAGVSNVRILDAGCGPGLWTKRIAEYAHRSGLGVAVVGFDISKAQLDMARKEAAKFLGGCPNGVKPTLQFIEHDLANRLPWVDEYFHLVLCNYTVLNHLAKDTLPGAIRELCRVTAGRVIATVRAVGSPPSACIIGMEQVREYRNDPTRGQLALVLKDGSQHTLPFNMYSSEALEALFAPYADIVDLRAMDLFVSRFAPDANWSASLLANLPERQGLENKLKEMEDNLCRLPGWIDHGTHILIVVQARADKCRSRPEPPVLEGTRVVTSFADFVDGRSR